VETNGEVRKREEAVRTAVEGVKREMATEIEVHHVNTTLTPY
jgi:hypothetical protein